MKNGSLRKKFDGLKYTLKKLEVGRGPRALHALFGGVHGRMCTAVCACLRVHACVCMRATLRFM
jgi:hypothetical protein